MKHLIALALLLILTVHLYEGKDYRMQVFTEIRKNRQRVITRIIIHPKEKFDIIRQIELRYYINRKNNVIANEHGISWEK